MSLDFSRTHAQQGFSSRIYRRVGPARQLSAHVVNAVQVVLAKAEEGVVEVAYGGVTVLERGEERIQEVQPEGLGRR